MTREDIENILTEMIEDNSKGTTFENCTINTFEDIELLTSDNGIRIILNDGETIYLTIQGYNENGIQLD